MLRPRILRAEPLTAGERRPLIVAWTRISERQRDLAHALGAETLIIYPKVRWTTLRYLLSCLITLLNAPALWRRPIIVSAPPIPAAASVALASLMSRRLVLDSHPGAFGLQGDALSRALQPLHRLLIRCANATMVTTPSLVEVVRECGGRGIVLWEPPHRPLTESVGAILERGRILVPFIFARDEPLWLVVDVARRSPEMTFVITGDSRRLSSGQQDAFPENILLAGFLNPAEYRHELQRAHIVLTLSTDDQSVMRTGFDAVWQRRHLVCQESPATEVAFPYATRSPLASDAIAEHLGSVVGMRDEDYDMTTQEAYDWTLSNWERQLIQLRRHMSLQLED